MKCKACKQCPYSEMIIKDTVYALRCTKYGVLGDTFRELLENVREEREEN